MERVAGRKPIGHLGLGAAAVHVIPVEPVVAAVVVDYVDHHIHAPIVGGIHQIPEVLPGAEAGVDVQKVLDAVAVVGLQICPLPPGGIQPEGGDAQILQIVELAGNTPEGATAELVACSHPTRFILHPVLFRLKPIKLGTGGFFAIAKAVGQELVEEVVAPVGGAGMNSSSGGKVEIGQAGRDLRFEGSLHGIAGNGTTAQY